MSGRLWTTRLRLGFLLRGLRRSKPKPTGADIEEVRMALVAGVGCANVVAEAARVARREANAAGVDDPDLDAALAVMAGAAGRLISVAQAQRERLGIDPARGARGAAADPALRCQVAQAADILVSTIEPGEAE